MLLTTHCSLLTTHYSLLTTHYSLLTTHYLPGAQLLLLGHAPPTVDYFDRAPLWQPFYAARYWSILTRYRGAVAGQLYGHMHASQFRVWDAPDAAPLLVLPSVSPVFGSQPSFALLTLGDSDGSGGGSGGGGGGGGDLRPSEMQAFYADMGAAQGGGAPPFEPLYSAAERLPAGGAALINRLTNRLTNLTNRRYAQWAASMSDLPEPTATAEAAWRSSNPDPNP